MISMLPHSDMLVSYAIVFMLILVRVGALFLTAPMFNSQALTTGLRSAIVTVVSLAVFFSLPNGLAAPELEITGIIIAILGEIAIGTAAGLAAQLVFAAVDGAGRLMSIPMGLAFAQAIDPISGSGSAVVSRFFSVIVGLVFFCLDAHHVVLRLIAKSFHVLPPGKVIPQPLVGKSLAHHAGRIFVGSVQLAAPVLLVILGVMVAMGLLAKIAPKVNLFMLSFAVSIGLGIIALRGSLPNVVEWIRAEVMRMEPIAVQVISLF